MTIKLAVLGDLHYPDYTSPELAACRDRVFREWFRQIAVLKPDLVIAVGDITQWGKPTEFTGLKAIVSEFNFPFIAIAGNHDCYTLNKSELTPFLLGNYQPIVPEELYTSFDRYDIRFILLDTAKPKEAQDYGGWVSETQGAWLRQQIREFNDNSYLKSLLVFGHHPLKNTTSRTEELKLHIENSEEIAPIFNTLERTPGYYFCGHNHQHSLHQTDRWWYIQSAAPWECLSFRWVTLTPDQSDRPLTLKIHHFDWQNDSLQQDWQVAQQSIPHFTVKSWEFANNLEHHLEHQ